MKRGVVGVKVHGGKRILGQTLRSRHSPEDGIRPYEVFKGGGASFPGEMQQSRRSRFQGFPLLLQTFVGSRPDGAGGKDLNLRVQGTRLGRSLVAQLSVSLAVSGGDEPCRRAQALY